MHPFLQPRLSIPLLVAVLGAAPITAQDDPLVQGISVIQKDAGRLSWSAQSDWIAYDKPEADGRYDIWLRRVDGSEERCLTCGVYDLQNKNNLNPTWHPSGDYIVFQAQSDPRRLKIDALGLSTPARGMHSELYFMSTKGRDYFQLTRVGEFGSAVLDPHFSHEGDRLVWSERVSTKEGQWGSWQLRVARLRLGGGVPSLSKVKTYTPGDQKGLLVAQGFTPNDRGIMLTGNLEHGQSEIGMDVYVLDLDTKALTRLTHSRRSRDQYARFAPGTDQIAWTSNVEIIPSKRSGTLSPDQLSDLWIMNVDGTDKQRLTFFNDPTHDQYLGEAHVGDFAWSPRGDQILAHVLWVTSSAIKQGLYLLQLDERFAR